MGFYFILVVGGRGGDYLIKNCLIPLYRYCKSMNFLQIYYLEMGINSAQESIFTGHLKLIPVSYTSTHIEPKVVC